MGGTGGDGGRWRKMREDEGRGAVEAALDPKGQKMRRRNLTALAFPWLGTRTLRTCAALHHTALPHTALHHTSLHHTSLHHTALHHTALHHTSLHHTSLHHTAPHCTTLHHTALYIIALNITALYICALYITSLYEVKCWVAFYGGRVGDCPAGAAPVGQCTGSSYGPTRYATGHTH